MGVGISLFSLFSYLAWLVGIMVIISSVKKSVQKANAKQENPAASKPVTPAAAWQNQRVVTDEDRAKLDEYRKRKTQGAYVESKPTEPNQNLSANRRRTNTQPNIVERAKENSKRYAGQDATLEEMETEHGHSERVGHAVADYVETEREAHRRMHEEPLPPIEEESCLGTIEDLMIKGYDGTLSFERDFIGEAQEFLASITIPG